MENKGVRDVRIKNFTELASSKVSVSDVKDTVSLFLFIFTNNNPLNKSSVHRLHELLAETKFGRDANKIYAVRPIHTVDKDARQYEYHGLRAVYGIDWYNKDSEHTKGIIVSLLEEAVRVRKRNEEQYNMYIQRQRFPVYNEVQQQQVRGPSKSINGMAPPTLEHVPCQTREFYGGKQSDLMKFPISEKRGNTTQPLILDSPLVWNGQEPDLLVPARKHENGNTSSKTDIVPPASRKDSVEMVACVSASILDSTPVFNGKEPDLLVPTRTHDKGNTSSRTDIGPPAYNEGNAEIDACDSTFSMVQILHRQQQPQMKPHSIG